MNQSAIIDGVVERVRAFHSDDISGHDWWHVYRVWRLACRIAENEGTNLYVVQLAALLHDTDDWKNGLASDSRSDCPNAKKIMTETGIDSQLQDRVVKIIGEVSFKGAHVNTKPTSPEACVVQDADRIDALGAIGVARAFAYGGSKGRTLYNPDEEPTLHSSFIDYKNSKGSTINHFHEKLLLLYDRLNTQAARRIALRRHLFMQDFLNRFLSEWNGNE